MTDTEEVLRTLGFVFLVLLWFIFPAFFAPVLRLLPESLWSVLFVGFLWLGLPFFLALFRYHRKGYEVAGLARLLD